MFRHAALVVQWVWVGCLIGCSGPLLGQTSDPVAPVVPLELKATLQGAEIGSETVELRPNGWVAEGSFDLLGTRSGEYRMERVATKDGLRVSVKSKSGGKDHAGILELVGTEFIVKAEGSNKEKKGTIESGTIPVVFENLVWASFVDLARAVERLESEGKLAPKVKLSALLLSGGVSFPIEIAETRVMQISHGGKALRVRSTKFLAPPKLEMLCLSREDGAPLRIEIPSQKIAVSLDGFADLRIQDDQPTSIVDSGPWREQLSKPVHKVLIERKVMVPMTDGIKLACDIYRPVGEGKFPTIFARTPYNRTTEGALKGNFYAQRGYVFVAQDVRGRFESEGVWFPFTSEARDGADSLTWIAGQPWSDGQVGMVGASYVGLVQWLAAKTGHPALKCIVPQVSPPDPHENFPYEGGAFLLGAAWWARVLESMDKGVDFSTGIDWIKGMSVLPLSKLDESMSLDKKSFINEWLAHPPEDRAFWESASYQDHFGKIDIPVMNITGWYDGDMPGGIQNFPGMRKHAKSEATRGHQYLVIGPWTHLFNSSRSIGDVDFGPEGMIDLDARILRFFDRYLKGTKNGIDTEPPVFVFTMGANRWSGERDWPLPETQWTSLYLASDGGALRRDGGGRLLSAPRKAGQPSEVLRYDPMILPKTNADYGDLSGAQVTADQSQEQDRADDLDYTTPPLAEACELVGPLSAVLYVSTDAVDTDFAVNLHRLLPSGKLLHMASGIQRLRYAKDPRAVHLVKPGTVVEITVDLWATGQRLEKGDRLQLRVTPWGWPGYARHLNTLDSPLTAMESLVAHNTVYHDEARPSHVRLPVVPRADAPGIRFVETEKK